MSKENKERFETIRSKIKDAIKEKANIAAVDAVVEASVKREIERRSDIIEKGLDAWSKANRELEKINRGDLVTFEPVLDKEGKDTGVEPVKVTKYSEARMKEIQKIKEQIAKLDMALLKALGEEANYEKLQSLIK